MRDYEERNLAISCVNFGSAKSGKTYFQLTMPKPLALFETDVGTFDRALPAYEFNQGKEMDVGEFCRENNELFLREDFPLEGSHKDIYIIRCPFIPDDEFGPGLGFYNYILALNRMVRNAIRDPFIQSVAIDTGTWFWQMQHHAEYLKVDLDSRQRAADGQGGRERLQQIEYTNPNARMVQIFREAGIYNKNLLFTCHERPAEYRNNYGEVTRRQSPVDGWAQFEKTATIITHSSMRSEGRRPDIKRIPQMDMYISGDSLGSINMRLDYPTWTKLTEFLAEHKPALESKA